jgi:hypothetical protein
VTRRYKAIYATSTDTAVGDEPPWTASALRLELNLSFQSIEHKNTQV